MYMGVLTICLCPVHMPGARGGQKTGSNLDLELQTDVNHHCGAG